MSDSETSVNKVSRRTFVKVAAYVVPAILTLKAVPSFAGAGSGGGGGHGETGDTVTGDTVTGNGAHGNG